VIARACLFLAVALGACTTEHQLFGDDDAILTTCSDVWATGEPDDACDLSEPCARDAPGDPLCCTQFAYCRMGLLVMDQTCNPSCVQCVDDLSCAPGEATCQGTSCVPCLDGGPAGQMCAQCPPGWVYLTRNGCQTCQCAPPSECSGPDGIVCGDPNMSEQCYMGASYADPGCSPLDPGCRADVCSIPGCAEPAPLGCFTQCDPSNPACGTCATDTCECDPSTGTWSCTQICIDQYPQSLTCFL
jgi:hypothetical protein